MSISRSYNHKSGVYYAYETIHEWSDEKQRNVTVRKCIGHFDPVTDEIVPNGKRGRKSVYPRNTHAEASVQCGTAKENQAIDGSEFLYLADMLQKITDICADAVTHFENMAKAKG